MGIILPLRDETVHFSDWAADVIRFGFLDDGHHLK
jgi:hypothetical protein